MDDQCMFGLNFGKFVWVAGEVAKLHDLVLAIGSFGTPIVR